MRIRFKKGIVFAVLTALLYIVACWILYKARTDLLQGSEVVWTWREELLFDREVVEILLRITIVAVVTVMSDITGPIYEVILDCSVATVVFGLGVPFLEALLPTLSISGGTLIITAKHISCVAAMTLYGLFVGTIDFGGYIGRIISQVLAGLRKNN